MKPKSYCKFFPFVIVSISHALIFYFVARNTSTKQLDFKSPSSQANLYSSPIEINFNHKAESFGKNKKRNIVSLNSNQASANAPLTSSTSNAINQSIEIENEFSANQASTFFETFELPQYPEMAREKNIEARIPVEISFSNDGTVQAVKFISDDHILFKASIEKALKRWKLRPSIKTQRITKTFYFKLK
jgi:TonB family protein